MTQVMNAWSILAAVAVVSLSSCGLSPEKEAVIAKARSIREFPVSRKALISTFGLEKQSGVRFSETRWNSGATAWETWQHPSGLTIAAYADYDNEVATGDRRSNRKAIDDILNGKNPDVNGNASDVVASVVLPGVTAMPTPPPPRKSFEGFEVKDGKRVVFQSDES